MGARLIILEDDASIGQAMTTALEGEGYAVEWFTTAASATDALEERPPALVLLDVGLPDVDGVTLCRWLRDLHPDLPIVLVTARDSHIDIVVGLDAGATDYVTKPFSMRVLLARVRAHLRTSEGSSPDAPVVVGPLTIEPAAYKVSVAGVTVELRKREFELLLLLARESGRVVSRERLHAEVWDQHWDTSSKTLEMHVMALRRKLGEAVEITTVRGVGYRLDEP